MAKRLWNVESVVSLDDERKTGETPSTFRRAVEFLRSNKDVLITFSLVTLSFAVGIVSQIHLHITPSTDFGESIEGVVSIWFWLSIAVMVSTISYMLTRLDSRKFRIPFMLSCVMLIISMRSVLALISPFPAVPDTWGGIYITESWRKYGLFSPEGLAFFSRGYVRGWPTSFALAYLFTSIGVPVYTFYRWAPTFVFILNLVLIYLLFKELANEKVGMVSAFLFTLLNTNSVFTLHYSAQDIGVIFYLAAMYSIVKAYKTRKLKYLAASLVAIFAVVITHHMTTLFLGISLAGAYFSKYFLGLPQRLRERNRWFSFTIKTDTFVKLSALLSVFTFALWYFYGFIVYRIDATWMLTEIVRLLTTHEPRYGAGYYYYYVIQSPLSKVAVLLYPALIICLATLFILGRAIRRDSLEGYVWLTMGWAGALILAFIFGNMIYGNYIDPSRSRELIMVALYPASASFLLKIFESKSLYKKGLVTILLVTIAFFSVFSIYRGAQNIIYFEPPWWMSLFKNP